MLREPSVGHLVEHSRSSPHKGVAERLRSAAGDDLYEKSMVGAASTSDTQRLITCRTCALINGVVRSI